MSKLYTKTHEWIELMDGTIARVGISDYAQKELGEIVFVDVTSEGETLKQFDTFGSIEAVKTVADLELPVNGTVVEVNGLLDGQPELINNSPEDEGWIITVDCSEFDSDSKELMSEEQYNEFCKNI